MSVAEGARAQVPALAVESGKSYVAALSSDARLLVFPLDEIPVRPNGGVGVQLLALPEKVTLAAVAVTDGKSLAVSGIKRKNRASETMDAKMLAEHMGKRAQRGQGLRRGIQAGPSWVLASSGRSSRPRRSCSSPRWRCGSAPRCPLRSQACARSAPTWCSRSASPSRCASTAAAR